MHDDTCQLHNNLSSFALTQYKNKDLMKSYFTVQVMYFCYIFELLFDNKKT